MKEKLRRFDRKTVLIFWVVLAYVLFLFVDVLILGNIPTITKIIIVFAVASFVYIAVDLLIQYFKVSEVLMSIKDIERKYRYFEKYTYEGDLIVEIKVIDNENFINDLNSIKAEYKVFSKDDKLVKYVISLSDKN